MQIFYTPDGHRRYAERENVSLAAAYERGYVALRDEVILPLIEYGGITRLCVFVISELNIRRRKRDDLGQLLQAVEDYLPRICEDCAPFARIRLFGSLRKATIPEGKNSGVRVDFFVGSDTEDEFPGEPVDIFCRSGGSIRLSGAPRALLGPYTEMFGLDKLHPEITREDFFDVIRRFEGRYILEGAA